MFDKWHHSEWFIQKTLRRLSHQRVVTILQPGNSWVIEKAVSEGESQEVAAALRTCHLRGWVEIQSNAVARIQLTMEGDLPEGLPVSGVAPVYRLTEAGWNVIHRSHEWVVVTFVIVSITLIVTIISNVINYTIK